MPRRAKDLTTAVANVDADQGRGGAARGAEVRGLERQIDNSDEVIALISAAGPVGIEIGERFGGDRFFERLPGRLELPYPVAAVASMSRYFTRSALVASGPWARHDLGVRIGEVEQAVTRRDHASTRPPVEPVDQGISAVEKDVAGVQDVGLLDRTITSVSVCAGGTCETSRCSPFAASL